MNLLFSIFRINIWSSQSSMSHASCTNDSGEGRPHQSWQLSTTVLQSAIAVGGGGGGGYYLSFCFWSLTCEKWTPLWLVQTALTPLPEGCLLAHSFLGSAVSKGSQHVLPLFGRECCSRAEYRVQGRQFFTSFTSCQNSQRKKIKSNWIKRKGKKVTEIITFVNRCPPCVLHCAGSVNGQMKN